MPPAVDERDHRLPPRVLPKSPDKPGHAPTPADEPARTANDERASKKFFDAPRKTLGPLDAEAAAKRLNEKSPHAFGTVGPGSRGRN